LGNRQKLFMIILSIFLSMNHQVILGEMVVICSSSVENSPLPAKTSHYNASRTDNFRKLPVDSKYMQNEDPYQLSWTQSFGGTGWDVGNSVIQTNDGGFAMTGWVELFDAYVMRIGLAKVDEDGLLQWNKPFGENDEHYGYDLAQLSDGGIVIAGYTMYDDYQFNAIKTDENGNYQWSKYYGGNDKEFAYAIEDTSDGGFAMAGVTQSFGAGSSDFWLVKADEDGNAEWNKTYGGVDSDVANSLVQTKDGGFAIAGITSSYGAGGSDIWLVKTDSGGNVEWNKTFGGEGQESLRCIVQTHDEGYAITGTTTSYDGDPWLIRVDSSGNIVWNRTYENAGDVNSLVQTPDDGFVLAGNKQDDGWLFKTDFLGNALWNDTFGGELNDEVNCIILTDDYGLTLAGTRNIGTLQDSNEDFWMVHFTSTEESHKIDSDNDGMPNYWEELMGLDPYDPDDAALDKDSDGMTNLWEYQMGLNATNSNDAALDLDGDGLTNLEEFNFGSWANQTDTDGDGMDDYFEFHHDLNPNDPNDAVIKLIGLLNETVISDEVSITLAVNDSIIDDVWYNWGISNYSLLEPWKISVLQAEGLNWLHVYANDSSSLETSVSFQFYIDITVPAIEILSPSSLFCTNSTMITVNATVTEVNIDRSILYVNGTEKGILHDSWLWESVELLLGDGFYNITVKAVDIVNHTSSVSVWVILDRQLPEIVLGSNLVVNQEITGAFSIYFQVNEQNIHYILIKIESNGFPDWIDITGSFNGTHYFYSWDSTQMVNGPHTIRLRVIDSAGNSVESSIPVIVDNPSGLRLLDPFILIILILLLLLTALAVVWLIYRLRKMRQFYCQMDSTYHSKTKPHYTCSNCFRYVCEDCANEMVSVGFFTCPMCEGELQSKMGARQLLKTEKKTDANKVVDIESLKKKLSTKE